MSIVYGPTSNFFYYNKFEEHNEVKEKIMSKITEVVNNKNIKNPFGIRCNVKSSYNSEINGFLTEDKEFTKKLIWNNCDKLIKKYNERNIFNLNIHNSIISNGWFNYYEKTNFQESHAHYSRPVSINNQIYLPSFSVIYILHDENDKNTTSFQYNPSSFTTSFIDDLGIIDTCKINDISEGTVIMFPFDCYHFVTPSNKKRITISYNIFSKI